MKRALMVATVSQSLRFQSPAMLDVLHSRGYDVTFAAREDSWAAELRDRGHFHAIDADRRPSPVALVRTRREMRDLSRGHWDLIQTQSPISSALIRTVQLDAPSIYVAHGFHFHRDGSRAQNAAFRSIEFALAGRTQAIAVVSQEDFAAAQRMGLHRRTLLWRLPGAGVDLAQFELAGDRPRDRQVLFCGELNANKDPFTVIGAVELMRSNGDRVELTIVGDGPLAPAIAEAAQRHLWLKWAPSLSQEHVASLMATCGVLAAPSHREGLPRVIIEALACGTPVVARSNRGSRELLSGLAREGRSALLGTSEAHQWARALSAQLEAGVAGVAGRRTVETYGIDNFAESYAQLIWAVESGQAAGAVDLDGQSRWSTGDDVH